MDRGSHQRVLERVRGQKPVRFTAPRPTAEGGCHNPAFSSLHVATQRLACVLYCIFKAAGAHTNTPHTRWLGMCSLIMCLSALHVAFHDFSPRGSTSRHCESRGDLKKTQNTVNVSFLALVHLGRTYWVITILDNSHLWSNAT